MTFAVRQSRGFGALSVSDEGPLRRSLIQAEELLIQITREMGDAVSRGLFSEADAAALDPQINDLRNRIGDLDARIYTISAQEIPAVQVEIDEITSAIENIGSRVRGAHSAGISSLVRKTGFWVAAGVVGAGLAGLLAWTHFSKKGRSRRSRRR